MIIVIEHGVIDSTVREMEVVYIGFNAKSTIINIQLVYDMS